MLGSAVATQHGTGEPAPNGADHDPCVVGLLSGAMQGRQHHLSHQQLGRQIDFDLATEDLERNSSNGPGRAAPALLTKPKSGPVSLTTSPAACTESSSANP